MLRRRRGLEKHLDGNASTSDFALRTPRSIVDKENEISSYGDALMCSGTQKLSRIGYDENSESMGCQIARTVGRLRQFRVS